MLVYRNTESTISQAIATMHKEISDIIKWSRAKKILDDGKLVAATLKRKYEAISDPEESSSSLIISDDIDNNSIATAASTLVPLPLIPTLILIAIGST